jgi:hypothetical protein
MEKPTAGKIPLRMNSALASMRVMNDQNRMKWLMPKGLLSTLFWAKA